MTASYSVPRSNDLDILRFIVPRWDSLCDTRVFRQSSTRRGAREDVITHCSELQRGLAEVILDLIQLVSNDERYRM